MKERREGGGGPVSTGGGEIYEKKKGVSGLIPSGLGSKKKNDLECLGSKTQWVRRSLGHFDQYEGKQETRTENSSKNDETTKKVIVSIKWRRGQIE